MPKKPVVLIIRDGWGDHPGGQEVAEKVGNAALLADTPFHETLFENYPVSHLSASGLDVGLPEGQMGNSEVGHLNLGAGRIVYQDLTRINRDIGNGSLAKNAVLNEALAKAGTGRLHLIGLVSDGGVHSHQNHLIELARLAHEAKVPEVMVHAITDGRDTSPTGGQGYLSECEDRLAEFGTQIVTVVGRYFAMDRDERWERNKLAWDAIVLGRGEEKAILPSEAVAEQYAQDKTDEFLPPLVFGHANEPRIREGDVIIFFNFRADRARQLSLAFLKDEFDGFDREHHARTHYVTLTEYDATYGCPVIFPAENPTDVLGQVVAEAGLQQLRIAETEKYPHVTYFFNGGVEEPFPGENRIIVPSPKVATYDLQPEMSAAEVTDKVLENLPENDLVILNFANPDMVGHTGSVKAAIKAVEVIDDAVRQVVKRTLELGGKLLITADHGNCEQMIKEDGSPHTAHTTNLVHLFYVAEDAGQVKLKDGILADVAPSLLDLLGVKPPAAMTGSSLVVR